MRMMRRRVELRQEESMSVTEAEVAQSTPSEEAPKNKPKQQREQSTIDFPYLGLDVAVEVVKAVNATGGQASRIEQAAAHLGEKPNTGAFRNKLAAARTFGLATYSYAGGTVALTPLGLQVADPDQEKKAKAEAFLQVALYRRVYEEYKGVALPPTTQALEAAMVGMGVSVKQKDKARQVFQRSAQEAGFFAYGATKLVYPALGSQTGTPKLKDSEDQAAEQKPKNGGDDGDGGGKKRHPFIEGLLETLPPVALGMAKTAWSFKDRQDWLQTAAGIFNLIYTAGPEDDKDGKVIVSVTPASKASAN
jgi:hypothetical protein